MLIHRFSIVYFLLWVFCSEEIGLTKMGNRVWMSGSQVLIRFVSFPPYCWFYTQPNTCPFCKIPRCFSLVIATVCWRSSTSPPFFQKRRQKPRPFFQRTDVPFRKPEVQRRLYRQPDPQRSQNAASVRRPFQLRRRWEPSITTCVQCLGALCSHVSFSVNTWRSVCVL